jgi:putative transcriptional regulator
MTDEEAEAAALSDPDARPMTPDQLRSARRVPRIKTMRRALALTQEEFAARYHIPIGTLRDWEQGRCEPDQPARAYLTAIARDPDGLRLALKRKKVLVNGGRLIRKAVSSTPAGAAPLHSANTLSRRGIPCVDLASTDWSAKTSIHDEDSL